jgi:hypothetical protein
MMEIEIDEWCPYCEDTPRIVADKGILDAIIRGEKPDTAPTFCPICWAWLMPCSYCHNGDTKCTECPFISYYENTGDTMLVHFRLTFEDGTSGEIDVEMTRGAIVDYGEDDMLDMLSGYAGKDVRKWNYEIKE